MRILFDKNIPVGLRRFLPAHEVRTILELNWSPQLKNGELLPAAVEADFDVLVTADQNIRYQQNLTRMKLSLVVVGSNIWPVVKNHAARIAETVNAAKPGSYAFVDIQLRPKPGSN